jgi:hypothetical protein
LNQPVFDPNAALTVKLAKATVSHSRRQMIIRIGNPTAGLKTQRKPP